MRAVQDAVSIPVLLVLDKRKKRMAAEWAGTIVEAKGSESTERGL